MPPTPPSQRRNRGLPRVVSAHVSVLRLAVLRNLEPPIASRVKWSRGKVPTIANVQILRDSHLFCSNEDLAELLRDVSQPTCLEGGARSWSRVMTNIRALPPADPAPEALVGMARAFSTNVLPMECVPSTRAQQWHNWRSVLTWAIAFRVTDRLLPMSMETLQALSWQLLVLECGPAHLQQIWGAISKRHHYCRLTPPLASKGEYAKWAKATNILMGRPKLLKFPIRKEHLWRLLSLPNVRGESYVVQRNVLATVLATVCCARVSEVAALQACDILYDFDTLRGDARFWGTAAVCIRRRKNDCIKKGLFPRIGRPASGNPAGDIVDWLKSYQTSFGLQTHRLCARRLDDREPCALCPPVFVKTKRQGSITVLTKEPCNRQHIAGAFTRALGYIHVASPQFSGVSARKGGLSTAIEAGVPKWALFFQSGHGQSKAARAYMSLESPEYMFATWAAFGF